MKSILGFITSALILATVLSMSTEAYSDFQEEFHKTIKIKKGKTIKIDNINGNVNVSSWDNDYVDVYALKKTRRSRDELDRVTIEVHNKDVLEITTLVDKYDPDEYSFFERLFKGLRTRNPKVTVEYTVKIPRTSNLGIAETTNGNVNITGTSGDTLAKTTNGRVFVDNVKGYINAISTNGNIEVINVEGSAEAKTTNGKVYIENVSGVVSARSTNSGIEIKGATEINSAGTTNGDIEISLTEHSSGDMDISTTNGSITLHVPSNFNGDVDLKTTNGSIKAENFTITLEKLSKNHLIGTIGNGGRFIKMKTTNGSINLEKQI